MIAFVSLFLGLVVGPQVIEVAVDPAVARVEVRLDDRPVGTLDGPPWKLIADFGPEPRPQELAAIAFDREGREAGVARQRLNLPRAPAEVGIVLEAGGEGGPRSVRLTWESTAGAKPQSIAVTFDGEPLPVRDPARIELPAHDPGRLHFLRAELDFSDTVASVAELAFGGTYADQVTTELTGVAVELAEGVHLPEAAGLAGWLTRRGAPLTVVAVEKGAADAVVVRDQGALAGLDRLRQHLTVLLRARGPNPGAGHALRHGLALGPEQRLQLLWPFSIARRGATGQFALFPSTPEFRPEDAGVYWLISRLRPPPRLSRPQKLAEAVAVAGLFAASRSQRRAVVLVLGPEPEDGGRFDPAMARRYLRALRVPLQVWVTDPRAVAAQAGWGEAILVSDPARLERAVLDLSQALDRQRILWVRGSHLPQEITLSPLASGIRLLE
jgi:hypothetical protein